MLTSVDAMWGLLIGKGNISSRGERQELGGDGVGLLDIADIENEVLCLWASQNSFLDVYYLRSIKLRHLPILAVSSAGDIPLPINNPHIASTLVHITRPKARSRYFVM